MGYDWGKPLKQKTGRGTEDEIYNLPRAAASDWTQQAIVWQNLSAEAKASLMDGRAASAVFLGLISIE